MLEVTVISNSSKASNNLSASNLPEHAPIPFPNISGPTVPYLLGLSCRPAGKLYYGKRISRGIGCVISALFLNSINEFFSVDDDGNKARGYDVPPVLADN